VGRGKGELDDENIENDGAETTRERQIETNGDGHAVFLSGSSANRDRATSENRKRTPAGRLVVLLARFMRFAIKYARTAVVHTYEHDGGRCK